MRAARYMSPDLDRLPAADPLALAIAASSNPRR
jgi:hypothetical protein